MKIRHLSCLAIGGLAAIYCGCAHTNSTASSPPARSPVDQVDVYLIGGQSNATGQGYLRNLPPGFAPDEHVILFHSGRPHLNSGAAPDTWIPLRQASESPDRFGPELGLGNRLQELYPTRRIALIKHAHSGTNLYAQWNPGANADDREHWGPQFIIFVNTVEAGLTALRNQGCQPVVRGMIWQQGENDATGGTNSENYGRNLAHFIQRVRAQFNAPNMIFVYGYVLPPATASQYRGRDAVRQGEHDVDQDSGSPLAVRGAFVVPTDDLGVRADDPGMTGSLANDRLHIGTLGMLELGRRMADKMAAAERAVNSP